ncbi:MAG TPA: DUF3137 domain-containing protein [Jatrophihabitans sp.]|jgi:hypothetical protein
MTVLVVLFVLFVAVLIAVGAYSTSRRRKKFAAWAAANGYRYEQSNDAYARLPWGAPWGQGHSRRALDILTGTHSGRQVCCFTYRYDEESGSGDNRSDTTYNFAVYWTKLPKQLGELNVGREGFGAKIARAIGFHDIELESEQFNRTFNVHADNPRFAYDVLNPQMMQWLLTVDAPGFRIYGGDLVLVERNMLRLENIAPRLDYLDQVIAQIPDFIWRAA